MQSKNRLLWHLLCRWEGSCPERLVGSLLESRSFFSFYHCPSLLVNLFLCDTYLMQCGKILKILLCAWKTSLPFVLQRYYKNVICQLALWKGQRNTAVERFSNFFGLRMPLYPYLKRALFMYSISIFTISEIKAEKVLKHLFINSLKNNNPLLLNIVTLLVKNSYTLPPKLVGIVELFYIFLNFFNGWFNRK